MAMLWVPGSILGDAGHAWGPMDPPLYLIDVGPAPGHQPSVPWLGWLLGLPLLYPLACELTIPKKRNQILALESPILLVQLHEGPHIIHIY